MEAIPKNSIFEFNHDTLEYLRRQYDLEKPGRIEEAINILEEWVKKQNHFVVKEFSRDYLERTIIISKGSVERAKTKLDNICRFRTLYPHFFQILDLNNFPLMDDIFGVFLPKLTKDHYRVYLVKNKAASFKSGFFDYYRYFIMQLEYVQAHDYCNGVVVIIDYTEANLIESAKWLNMVDIRDALMIMRQGYGMRVKGLYLLSESTAINVIIQIFKQALSSKVAGRLCVHKKVDTLLDLVGKEVMPIDYGGNEKPLLELCKKYQEILTSDNYTKYLNYMSKACTNENLRLLDKNANNDLGLPGSFRTLNVD